MVVSMSNFFEINLRNLLYVILFFSLFCNFNLYFISQATCREFESRYPLQKIYPEIFQDFFIFG